MSGGQAMRMKLELARLARRHGISPTSVTVPLSAPTDGPMTLSGLASTVDVDLTRQKFRGWAFTNLALQLSGYPFPKLFYRHNPNLVAGEITSLSYDAHGQLLISADVIHELARRANAFSVCATILQYEIRNADSPDYFALISKAEISHIGLTDQPANPNAVVLNRHPIAPVAPFLKTLGEQADLSIKAVRLIQRKLELLWRIAQSPASLPAMAPCRAPGPAAITKAPRRPTQFQQLVQEMKQR